MRTKKSKIMKNEIAVYTAPLKEAGNHVVVKFPKDILEYLKITSQELMWVPTNGTIQLIGTGQQIAMPLMPIDKDSFVAQKA